MLFPSIFSHEFADPFDTWERKVLNRRPVDLMKTDVRENEHEYLVDVDLPGFDKSDIKLSLEDGYLTVSASREDKKEEKDEKTGSYIRRERYVGACERSFYVGEDLTVEDIKAAFDKGVLSITIPKKELVEKAPEKKYISISGGEA